METFLIKAAQLIFSLSILVIVHEFGHFIFARLFKIKVEKFYLFFDPWFALFRYKPKKSDTEYGLGWLPLGGYVKIAGMIDESMDKEQLKQPPQPWEFRSKPASQRLLVMVAGVIMNLLLAFFIYAMIVFNWGDSYFEPKNAGIGMEFSETAHEAGFQDGDIILSIDGKRAIERFGVVDNLSMQAISAKQVIVLRDGKEVAIDIPSDLVQKMVRAKKGFASYRIPTVVNKVNKGSRAEQMGLQTGDSLVAINSVQTPTFNIFSAELKKYKNETIELSYFRNGAMHNTTVQLDSTATLGFVASSFVTTEHYSMLKSFPHGVKYGLRTLKGYIAQLKYVFTKEGASSIGGFGTIGNFFPAQWDWYSFWTMTAFLSVMLAFMNILPIPGLDGGHVMFLLFEVITGRKPSDKFLEYAQMAGMVFLLSLVLYANGLDIFRAIFK